MSNPPTYDWGVYGWVRVVTTKIIFIVGLTHRILFIWNNYEVLIDEQNQNWGTSLDKLIWTTNFLTPPPTQKKNIFIHFWMNWDILMLFQFKCLKFIFFVKSSRIQGGEHAIRQIRFAWPYLGWTKIGVKKILDEKMWLVNWHYNWNWY